MSSQVHRSMYHHSSSLTTMEQLRLANEKAWMTLGERERELGAKCVVESVFNKQTEL